MARKGNPISVRLDLNRSSDSSRFSKGDRESHRMGHSRGCKPDGTQLGFETVCKRKSYHFCLYLYYSFLFFWNFVRICLALYSMFKGVCSMLPDLDLNMPPPCTRNLYSSPGGGSQCTPYVGCGAGGVPPPNERNGNPAGTIAESQRIPSGQVKRGAI